MSCHKNLSFFKISYWLILFTRFAFDNAVIGCILYKLMSLSFCVFLSWIRDWAMIDVGESLSKLCSRSLHLVFGKVVSTRIFGGSHHVVFVRTGRKSKVFCLLSVDKTGNLIALTACFPVCYSLLQRHVGATHLRAYMHIFLSVCLIASARKVL